MTASTVDVDKAGNTRVLAEYLAGLRYEDLPGEAVEQLKIFTLECIGHMVLAHAQPVRMLLVFAQ